ncbi:MAG: DNA topoisomerase III [Clostridiales bacterium]|jgi:DNA topoisomerase-3|nr:DNA topoisomerase III [Clostridiales bacterium]
MKTLIIAEKPSVGKDIARVLGCKNGGSGFMEGSRYVVTWALGHLVTLAEPENYDAKFKAWNLEDLPIMPEKLQLVVIPQTAKQYHTVKELLFRGDVSDIVIATDAGREGELVARWILEKAKCAKPVKRLWISSVTDKAITDGFHNLKDGAQYINLLNSAKARAEADWLVGINATRCLTAKFNSQLSCGRVQTPTVAIIAKREEEIRKFVPQKYYGLSAIAAAHPPAAYRAPAADRAPGASETFSLVWADGKSNDTRSFDRQKTEALLNTLRDKRECAVRDITRTAKKKYPPKLYDLTELQRDANKRFGYSPKETLAIMQKLYEQHKILTYPRTDSRYITTDIVPTLPERIRACAVKPYAKTAMSLLRAPIRANANFVDNGKVSDHHAIIPTEEAVDLGALDEKERKIYDLVITRFLSVFYPPFEYEQTTLKVNIGGETFTARGKAVLAPGYTAVYQGADVDEEDEAPDTAGGKEQALPRLKAGDKLAIRQISLTEGRTGPPAPFNEATLLSAMENPAKYMDSKDKSIADTLGQTGGLGTVATRADIIDKLFDNFLIEKKGKDIFTTSKGRQLLKLVPPDLKSPEMTGQWEQKLLKISNGKLGKDVFLREIRSYTTEIITGIKSSTEVFRHDNLSTTKCPNCGKFMLEVNGKKGKMLVCQDRECGARVNLSFTTRSRCPECGKFLEITGDGDRKEVVCSCGHSEKYDAFIKRKSSQPSKKEVQEFMAKLKKDDVKNNPFAALQGLKL